MPVFPVCCLCLRAGFSEAGLSFGRAAGDLEHRGALMQCAYTPYITSIYADSQTISRIFDTPTALPLHLSHYLAFKEIF